MFCQYQRPCLTKEKLHKRLDPGASKTFSSPLPEIQIPTYFQSTPHCDELGASRTFCEVTHRRYPLIPAMGRSFFVLWNKNKYFPLFSVTFQLQSCSQDDNYAGIPSRNILGGERVPEGSLFDVHTGREDTRLYFFRLQLSSGVYVRNRS